VQEVQLLAGSKASLILVGIFILHGASGVLGTVVRSMTPENFLFSR
jgi:hypothetical protein